MLASERMHVEIQLDGKFMVIGERINPTGKKKLQAELKEGSLSMVRTMATEQEENGAQILDINMGMNGIDEKQMMLDAIYEVTSTVDLPLCIDSSHVDIIEAALRIYPGRALVNSISLEKERSSICCRSRRSTVPCLSCCRSRTRGCRRILQKSTGSSARS